MGNRADSDSMFMDWAWRVAERSHAERLKVGCVIEKNDSVISYGWNGMPKGFPNRCEHEQLKTTQAGVLHFALVTNPEVSHAEMNAYGKLTESTISSTGATTYCTHSPCLECAKLIQRTGTAELVYDEDFRSDEGIYLLRKRGILVRQI